MKPFRPDSDRAVAISYSTFKYVLDEYVNRDNYGCDIIDNFEKLYSEMMIPELMTLSEYNFALRIITWKLVSKILSKRLSEEFVRVYINKVSNKIVK